MRTMLTILGAAAVMTASAQFNRSTSNTQEQVIRISTNTTDLVLEVAKDGRLYQTYLGERLLHEADVSLIRRPGYISGNGTLQTRSREVVSCAGNEDYFEPALGFVHADGNRSTYLYYKDKEQTVVNDGAATETVITLADNKYPVEVKLHYVAYQQENIIRTWSEIRHQEKTPIRLTQMNATMLYLDAPQYFLTEFSSDWAAEVRRQTTELTFGKKTVDTKLGSRANLFCQPIFEVGLGAPARESEGTVLMGTVSWTGNWSYTLEVDNHNVLCVLPGLNNFASDYTLKPNQVFTTPEFIFTLSQNGMSQASRNLHDWARNYIVKDGRGTRLTLLNNWENTYFDFDEPKLAQCMREAKDLGVDLFLLDDGWFGNGENARNGDTAGLGDWEVNHAKLPNGVPGLVKAAKEAGVKFGIWIEPEMVNPKSELMQKHPDWVIKQPNREVYVYRNQLVLDMANPKVQDYVYSVVENIMKENPEIAFFKWDCNSPITNIYSPYEKQLQGNLYVDHARGVQAVMKRVAEAYPDVPMMLCSGGGGRCDYEALKYFTEFWPSDDTNPVERIYMQWNFSQFFPAKTLCAHVTSWNRRTSVKFRTDVASMCKLGFDIGLHDLSKDELQYCREAIKNWKRLNPAIMDGDQYRLVSPYECNHMALNYVSKDKASAVLFAYDVHPRQSEQLLRVKPEGLDANAMYLVREINLMPGQKSGLQANGKTYSGDYLMKVGIDVFTRDECRSRVVEFIRQ